MRPWPSSWNDLTAWRRELRLALAFLTRVPLRLTETPAEMPLAASGWAFPLVGAVVGFIGGAAYWVVTALGIPVAASALLAVGATILFTGGLHEDGLADTADGLGGGASVEDKLAIMRDSRSGAFGVLALVLSVGVRAAAIAALGGSGKVMAALVAAHAVGRAGLPATMRWLEPARRDGLGAAAGRPAAAVAIWAMGIGLVIAVLALGLKPGLAAVLAAGVVMAAKGRVARRAIGGYTGDVLGAIEQGGEIAMLLAAAAGMR
jgi:adenosylcobinamide-GDP ribazoletransferase